ncbi:hypothetical protein [Bradyrhizobium sp.]|uniref:hypothetical protein n=1 Tax=Bradyrhizobium sp. TaxID=376 RepID=UPI0039E5FE13
MNALFWRLLARIVCKQRVFDWMVKRGERAPYRHITGQGTDEIYMYRYWLFNPYPHSRTDRDARSWWRKLLPSVRLHRIMREDQDRDLHDHPWNARTIILRGFYVERREQFPSIIVRMVGSTSTLKYGEYHRIAYVSGGGVWTLFFTWRLRGEWGFKVNGVKIPWREYLGIKE